MSAAKSGGSHPRISLTLNAGYGLLTHPRHPRIKSGAGSEALATPDLILDLIRGRRAASFEGLASLGRLRMTVDDSTARVLSQCSQGSKTSDSFTSILSASRMNLSMALIGFLSGLALQKLATSRRIFASSTPLRSMWLVYSLSR